MKNQIVRTGCTPAARKNRENKGKGRLHTQEVAGSSPAAPTTPSITYVNNDRRQSAEQRAKLRALVHQLCTTPWAGTLTCSPAPGIEAIIERGMPRELASEARITGIESPEGNL